MKTPEQTRIHAAEARQLLENKHLKEAFSAVDQHLNDAALSCNPDDKEKAQRIIISKQLLQAVKREIVRKIEDGDVAEIQMAEIERRKGLRIFQR